MVEFLQENWVLLVGLVVIAAFTFKGPILMRLSGVGSVDAPGAVRLINQQDAKVVDVREDKEWRQGHIPGAVHIPLGQLPGRMDELEPYRNTGSPLVVACRSGNRSANAAVQLRKAGFQPVYNLSGGTMGWQQSGMPLEE
ncbi:MAG TPA: rhodanese-like domain-containing protein [Gammaproteobacteria bacterium]|nr:rhodanese-like domain-containing protein [Gammaproteobacteria bacterium]